MYNQQFNFFYLYIMDTDVFNAVFWSFFITSVIGLILKCSSMAYKSKCKEVSLCCLKIVRDTGAEENLDEAEAQRGITRNETKDNV